MKHLFALLMVIFYNHPNSATSLLDWPAFDLSCIHTDAWPSATDHWLCILSSEQEFASQLDMLTKHKLCISPIFANLRWSQKLKTHTRIARTINFMVANTYHYGYN
jgi:hypothetical protein